jgi:hypothetical protein
MHTTTLNVFALVFFCLAIVGFLEVIEEFMATYKTKVG